MEKYKYDSVLIGENIMRLRKQKKWSREELSFRVGKSVSHLAQIEQGSRKMSVDMFVELMNTLGVDANELLGIVKTESETLDGLLCDMNEEKRKYFVSIFMQIITMPIK